MEEFSVLMSVYHKENADYLRLSLASVFSQTRKASQLVLVKDGPLTTELEEVINEYQGKYPELYIVPLSKNEGLSNALNIGLSHCHYDIVARMDSDDICYKNRFELQIAEFERQPSLDILGSFATMIDESGKEHKTMTVPLSNEDIAHKVWTCPFIHPTVVFRKERIIAVGSYNAKAGPRQDDYDLWFRCVASNLNCRNLGVPLLYYRFFADNIGRNSIKVGWARFKVGINGAIKCKCAPVAYLGVCYPLIRSLMPPKVQAYLYRISDRINPRVQK